MTENTASRSGPFWDMLEGRLPAPPAAKTLGWSLVSVNPEIGEIEVAFNASENFVNPWGSIQGGFLAAMLDDTLGPALAAQLEPNTIAPTLELKTNFLRPASPGLIHGSGRVVHRTGSVAFLTGELRNTQAEILATATATARIIRIETGDSSR